MSSLDPVGHDEFEDALRFARKHLRNDLYPYTATEVKYTRDYRLHIYVDGRWDSYEVTLDGLIKRIKELAP